MKRILTTVLAVALLLGLGALAVLAMPSADAPLAAAPVVSAAAAAPEAVDATIVTPRWNAIAVPLDVTDSGVNSADKVSAHIESFCQPTACPDGVPQVAYWDASAQTLVIRSVGGFYPADFPVETGDSLMVAIADPSLFSAASFAWVGDVPPMCADDPVNCVQHTLVPTGWNFVMVPLEKGSIATADALAADIDPNATQVAYWDAEQHTLVIRSVGGFYPLDYSVKIGYPYLIYANGITDTTWP